MCVNLSYSAICRHTPLELVKISDVLRDALREAYELARAGEIGELRRVGSGILQAVRQ